MATKKFTKYDELQMEVYKQQKQEETIKTYKELGWPEMEGTPAQVVWAMDLKIKLYEHFVINQYFLTKDNLLSVFGKEYANRFKQDIPIPQETMDEYIDILINYTKSWDIIKYAKYNIKYNKSYVLLKLVQQKMTDDFYAEKKLKKEAEQKLVKDLLDKGLKVKEVAQQTGFTTSKVYKIRAEIKKL